MEVSGLSIGLNSGSTAFSGNNNTISAMVNSADNSTQNEVPRLPSPHPHLPNIPRPPINLVYSRRNRETQSGQHSGSSQGMGSSSRASKGKGIMPEKPTLQHFLNAATDEQVTEGRLITEGQETAGQIVPAQGGNTTMEDETS
ncbi:hypothetical protein GUJ93_ZPchr0006g46363 [Zizania palustris]|uniref:Uncharacterized protein n=1 Tax=Zizania palustris TaxID=103762 RepID=A0A8J5TE60_ZIZPA|nr:hypothetical protein GUJ93_ZPchr0006g46363 [Zizania palustris]